MVGNNPDSVNSISRTHQSGPGNIEDGLKIYEYLYSMCIRSYSQAVFSYLNNGTEVLMARDTDIYTPSGTLRESWYNSRRIVNTSLGDNGSTREYFNFFFFFFLF